MDALKQVNDEPKLSEATGTSIESIDDANDAGTADETEKQPALALPYKTETKLNTAVSPACNYSSTINNGYQKPAIRS